MATASVQQIKRDTLGGQIAYFGIAVNRSLPQGTLCFRDSAGFATDVRVDSNSTFLGIVRERGGSNQKDTPGDSSVECWVDGVFELPAAGLGPGDVGQPIYAGDNYTLTRTATGNPQVGTVTEVIDAETVKVSIQGLTS